MILGSGIGTIPVPPPPWPTLPGDPLEPSYGELDSTYSPFTIATFPYDCGLEWSDPGPGPIGITPAPWAESGGT